MLQIHCGYLESRGCWKEWCVEEPGIAEPTLHPHPWAGDSWTRLPMGNRPGSSHLFDLNAFLRWRGEPRQNFWLRKYMSSLVCFFPAFLRWTCVAFSLQPPQPGSNGSCPLGPEVLLLPRVLFSLHYWVTAGHALFPRLLRKVLAVCKSLPAASLFYYPLKKNSLGHSRS